MKEKCAVFGVKSSNDVFESIYYALHSMQHRGQESAGIACSNDKIRIHKDMGLVRQVFKNAYLAGSAGIGHVRYSTTGDSKVENAHPLLINYSKGSFAIAHNGNIVNHTELKQELEAEGATFITTSDTEIIAKIIAHEHLRCGDFIEGIRQTMKQLVGSYSLTLLYDGKVYGVRDPGGVRPLCLGIKDGSYYLASESCALDVIGASLVRDIKPSEIIELGDSVKSFDGPKGRVCHCMFEYVYFARADSVMDGRAIYDVRLNLGKNLAKELPVEADMVCAVPDSGITHAIGYSRGSGIPYGEALIKNRYVGRTFILPNQKDRELSVRVKSNPLKCEVAGKEIIIVDDSLVRGTTMKRIVAALNAAGAKKVHVRIASPPVKNPCFYGIDMQTHKEFIASKKEVDEICKIIGADTLAYLSIDGLVDAIGFGKKQMCLACLNGDYPLEEKQKKLTDK